MKKMYPVVHFELPCDDRDRMCEFYSSVFGWNPQKLGPEMGNYTIVKTAETDEKGYPTQKGIINGGLFPRMKDAQHPTVVIAVEDIYSSMKDVENAGGKIIGGGFKAGEPDDIPGVGLYIAFSDSEGNRIGMLQPKGM
ncbi:MAG: Lactoylglutathione lyase-like protein [Chlorobi bacterium OLB5]|nr:MAG: Lactoylglutathione lyase-like protein [Chlorobi bacterium OLB5]